MPSGNPFLRVTRNVPRRNYHALNNGRSALFGAQPVAEIPEPEVQDASFDTGSNPSIARLRLNRHRNLRAPHRLLLRS